jgi:hypothetical protein
MGTQQEGIFLPGLARAFESVDTRGDLSTLQFAKACEAILPVFDRLGMPAGRERPTVSGNPDLVAFLWADSWLQGHMTFQLAQHCAHRFCRRSLRFCKVRADCKGIASIPTPPITTYAGQAFAFAQKDMVVKVIESLTQHLLTQIC